jgi:prevent-host-death family protein
LSGAILPGAILTSAILTNALHVATFWIMITVPIRTAKNRLTELARQVENGATITVTRNGRPVFDIVPHRKRGGLNLAAGQAFLASAGIMSTLSSIADDFDAPLAEDFLLQPLPLDA